MHVQINLASSSLGLDNYTDVTENRRPVQRNREGEGVQPTETH